LRIIVSENEFSNLERADDVSEPIEFECITPMVVWSARCGEMEISKTGKKGRMRRGERNAERERESSYYSVLARVF